MVGGRKEQTPSFVPGFLVFVLWIGLSDDSTAYWELPPAVAGGDSSNKDTAVHLAVKAYVAE